MKAELLEVKILDIYSSIQSHSIKSNFFKYLSSLFEFTNIIIIIDIVFNFKRENINITFPVYFLSPIFYLEFFYNKFVKESDLDSTCRMLNEEDYKNDQINKILHKYLSTNIYCQNCFYDGKILRLIILILLLSSLILHMININKFIITLFKYILSFLMYFLLRTVILVTLVIFNREIIIQISDYYDKVNISFILGLALFIFFCLIYGFFMSLLIYSFFENSNSYLHDQSFLFQEVVLQELSSIIIILRLNLKHSIVIEFFWIFFLVRFFISKIQDMVLINCSTKEFKIYQISLLFLITFFFERLIVFVFIKFCNDEKIFKVLDLTLIIFLFFVLFYFFYEYKKFVPLSSINENFKNKNALFFYGLSQIFSPITKFFEIKLSQGKISGKEREIVDIYVQYFKNSLFKNEEDFLLIGDLKEKLILLFSEKIKNQSQSTIASPEEDREKIIYNILLFFIKNFKKNIENEKNEFDRKVIEILHYYKIQLFFIMDDKTFRAQYYLQNFRYSKLFLECPLVSKCIFKSIRTCLLTLEKKSEDNSMASIIIFQHLNNEYFKILKCFKTIINNLTESKYDLYHKIDMKSYEIKSSLNQIIEINKHADDEYKLRSQPEFDKFQLVEEILFNDNSGKNFDFYDSNSLDSVVEKNDSFLILFEKNEFIIKKAPLPYYEYTKRKTNKLKEMNLNNIFPAQIAKNQMKIIKKHLLKDRHYTIDTVFEDSNCYITGTKLHFSMLPTFQGQIYIICKIEPQKDFEVENYALFERENSAIKFGTFFKDYFGVSSEHTSVPIINLFGIKNFSFKTIEKEYNISFSRVTKLVKKNFEKFSSNKKSNYEHNLTKLKDILKGNKSFNLDIKIKNKFNDGTQDYYLIQFNVIELIKHKKQKKNVIETQETQNLYAPSIRDTASVASAISTRLHKENAWNITTQAKKKQKTESNIFSTISFCYSVFLIGLAVFICIYTKVCSNNFKKDYTNISVFRKNNMDFVWGQFSLSNMITKKPTGDPFDDLFAVVSNKIPGFNLSFFQFYLEIFQNTSISFFIYQNQFKKQFGKISKSNSFYKVLYQTFEIFDIDEGSNNVSYFECFDLIFTNYYTISQSIVEIIRFKHFDFDDIPDNVEGVPEPNATSLELIYNYPKYFTVIENVIYEGKEYFNNSYKNFRFIIYLFFILFFSANLFGIIIILLSINLSTKILRYISKEIISITHKQLKSLKKKLKYGKLLLLNERKPSSIIEELKRLYAYNRARKKQQQNAAFMESGNSNTKATNADDSDDYIPVVDLKKKEKKYYFRIFIQSIENLLLSLLLYGILLIITFPLMKNHFGKISTQKDLTDRVDDLNIYLVHYLIKTKISILFNSTLGMDQLINNQSIIIYNNYTSFASIVEEKENYHTLLSKAGSENACEAVLDHIKNSKYYESLIQVCRVDSIFEARYSVKLSGFLSKIRSIYLSFLNDRHRPNFMFSYFAGYKMQTINLFEYIFFMTFLGNLEEDYIKPDLEIMINELTNFILIIFIVMIIFQIFNYIQGSFIILDRFVQIIEVYKVIGKFFEMKEKTKSNEKAK